MFVGMGANGASGGYNLENSLRFRSSASAYLSRTPTVTSNQKTWTWSSWVKRGKLGVRQHLFASANPVINTSGQQQLQLCFDTSDKIELSAGVSAVSLDLNLVTTQVFRDPSAWYHIVISVDTTQATAANRIKLYVNGVQVTSFSAAAYPVLNYNTSVNLINFSHRISGSGSAYLDGYQTEVNLVDGQTLTQDDFGDTNEDTGVWQPKKYTGTYGTNGFYLPFKPTTQATGFNTVLYTGNGGTQTIDNIGFSPDLVWLKNRGTTNSHYLSDTVRGNEKAVNSNTNAAEFNYTPYGGLSFVPNGFYVETGTSNVFNTSGNNFVAWCWDAGSGSPVSNTDGTITSTVKANPATGFSVVSYTGTSAIATIGHGLGVAPKIIIVKNRTVGGDPAGDWWTWHTSIGINQYIRLNLTNAVGSSSTIWNNTLPTSSVFSVGNDFANTSASNYVAYCFSDVAGYQKIGTYTGNGSTTGPVVTTGFRPAFVMIKRADSAGSWVLYDITRSVDNPINDTLTANASNAEVGDNTSVSVNFNSDGFQITSTGNAVNTSGGTYIYLAIADTRDAQFNFDASGNHNNWEANNINSNASSDTTYDIMTDVPTLTDEDTANYAVMNPLVLQGGGSLSDGNINATIANGVNYSRIFGTIGVSSGKYYWEYTPTSGTGTDMCGIASAFASATNYGTLGAYSYEYAYYSTGQSYNNAVLATYGASYVSNDVIGVALDMNAGTLTFYKNNVSQGVAYSSLSGTFFPALGNASGTTYGVMNFGQRPFAYTPPAGYKKLNTFNLPDSSIEDGSKYFNTVPYPGSDSTQSITGVGFSPNFVWMKNRTSAANNILMDTIRGGTKFVESNTTAAETTVSGLLTFDTDGFSPLGGAFGINAAGSNYVAWNWKAGGTAVSNTAGTITSSVSANPTAGFSVVTYTGNGTVGATVGHGLGASLGMLITKPRSISGSWAVASTGLGTTGDTLGGFPESYYITLNNTDGKTNNGSSVLALGDATKFAIGSGLEMNQSGATYVAYCWSDVEGYSKFGSYTGNGSTDGPFVYTGFRPALIMIKCSSSPGGWYLLDATRDINNPTVLFLAANNSNAEGDSSASGYSVDFLSNGFKQKGSGTEFNGNGLTFIYMAFAESPFKVSLAR